MLKSNSTTVDGNVTTSKVTPPKTENIKVPAQDVPAQDVPAQDVPAQDVPAQDVPAQEETNVTTVTETVDGKDVTAKVRKLDLTQPVSPVMDKTVKVWGRIMGRSQHYGYPEGGWVFPVLFEGGVYSDLRGTSILEACALFTIATLDKIELFTDLKSAAFAVITPIMVSGTFGLWTNNFEITTIDAEGKSTVKVSPHNGLSKNASDSTMRYDQRVNTADKGIHAALVQAGYLKESVKTNGNGNSATKTIKALVEVDSEEEAIKAFLAMRKVQRAKLNLA